MSKIEAPYFPIIYVRGYAGSQAEVEETVATPFMGFNLGSTKVRQRWTGALLRHAFESPLVRLMKDHGYVDAYRDGEQAAPGERFPARSVFIYRYYDPVSRQLGTGRRPEIMEYADGLGAFILDVRDRVCGDSEAARRAFRVYLVAHSMGGLVCRCFLQNPETHSDEARSLVDKVFTYATPHNGIDLNVLGNVPGFFSRNNSRNFNRRHMRRYLALPPGATRVDELNDRFPEERFFCLVGTNHRDYTVAGGTVRHVVGELSDGLVRIANATVRNAPRAFVHRSHSGDYGIVNSEEGYQNLERFLFGDYRVDGVLNVRSITLPAKIEREKDRDKRIRASYHFESIVRVRGASWDLHRRTAAEGCAVFRTYEELFESGEQRQPYLFSVFLRSGARVNRRRASLGFSIDLRVLVPDYEVGGILFLDDHYDGGHLYREKINVDLVPKDGGSEWSIRYGFDSQTPNRATRAASSLAGGTRFDIPIHQASRPGIDASLTLDVRRWEGEAPTPIGTPDVPPFPGSDTENPFRPIEIRPIGGLELPGQGTPVPRTSRSPG